MFLEMVHDTGEPFLNFVQSVHSVSCDLHFGLIMAHCRYHAHCQTVHCSCTCTVQLSVLAIAYVMLFHYSAGIGKSGGQSILFCPCTALHVEKLSMHFSETMIKQYTMEIMC